VIGPCSSVCGGHTRSLRCLLYGTMFGHSLSLVCHVFLRVVITEHPHKTV
jgi:hypothetical protein